jgi:hypothetical protein
MSLILAWVLFPLVMAALGWGWGTLVELAGGRRINDALLIPAGLAAALVVAGTITAFPAIAPATITVVALGAAVGLVLAVRARRGVGRWALIAAAAVVLVYGAPVILSGQATFTGVVKLDDTAAWLGWIDHVISHGRSVTGLPLSTYKLVVEEPNPAYPLGAFMLPGVARGLTGIDTAWIFQPYLACCAAAVGLCIYALVEPLIASPKLRALVAFVGAQSALLYAYSLWSGIKELTAAFLVVLGMALAAEMLSRLPRSSEDLRGLVPLAVAAGALLQVLDVGAGAWIAPALAALVAGWLLWGRTDRLRAQLGLTVRRTIVAVASLALVTAICIVPVWTVISSFLGSRAAGLFSSGQSQHTRLGNLFAPLKALQLAGVWLMGDFREVAPLFPTGLFIAVIIVAAIGALWWSARRRQFGIWLYVGAALLGCVIFYLGGATPWVTAKALAISSPAVLTAALVGTVMLWERRASHLPPIAGGAPANPVATPPGAKKSSPAPRRKTQEKHGGVGLFARYGWVLGMLGTAFITAGVLWSNVLAYGDATLAARSRMNELQHIGHLVANKGPTLLNEYEVYGDRHFLREGTPTEPAEYRPASMPTVLRNGTLLTKSAWADLNSFQLSTVLYYRSIITRRSPVESRPPSIYSLVYSGRNYQLWQRPDPAPHTILEQIPYGESNQHPYCGQASNGPPEALCSAHPIVTPSCPQLHVFAHKAAGEHAHLVAYTAPEAIFHYGDEVLWPATWFHEPASHALIPEAPGTATYNDVVVPTSQRYEVFLGGSFSRGLEVSVDGHKVGLVKNELGGNNQYVPVGAPIYLKAGTHKIAFTYPSANLDPGSAQNTLTSLYGYALEPLEYPHAQMLSVSPAEVGRLCATPLNWVEIVAGAA